VLAPVAAVLLAAGCGSASDPSPPAGVDGLVIPTASPEPDDFTATIDNPWLPLAAGATWSYASDARPATRLQVTVADGPSVAGVATAAVRSATIPSDRGETSSEVDYFAQDDDGNVWWFGRQGEWRAGEDGAEAGVAMLARPRRGDGYAEMAVDGHPGQRSVIVELDGESLVIETTTAAGDVVRTSYVRGTGPVLRDLGPDLELGLVAHDGPPA
jgi:hypothetical protein